MVAAMAHRGPNGQGVWHNTTQTQWLGHRRLSVYDLSEAAAQPFHYQHCSLVFNGAIYNFKQLRQQLAGHGYPFTTQTDTEVIAAAYLHWGMEAFNRLDGMWAVVLIDHRQQTALAIRDRFGEKPLFWHQPTANSQGPESLVLASEMKALWAGGALRQMHPHRLLAYLAEGLVQNPANATETFYKEINQVPAGGYLRIHLPTLRVEAGQWYGPQPLLHQATPAGNAQDWATKLYQQFAQAIQLRLQADVTVGTSLSGGLDSSSIVATIHQWQQQQVLPASWAHTAITAIFKQFPKNEEAWANQVAGHFGLQHIQVQPTPHQFESQWQAFMHHQEEPVTSASPFVQYLVYQLAGRRGITVMLDGQGADEVWAGYPRYGHWFLQQMLRQGRLFTFFNEKALLHKTGMLKQWNLKNLAAAFLPNQAAARLQKTALKLAMHGSVINPQYASQHLNPHLFVKPAITNLNQLLHHQTFAAGLQELLRYADRNAMAHGVEVRLPFLQHELVAFAFSLPATVKMHQGYGKWLLRKAMEPYLPPAITWRTDKVGYEPPQQAWLSTPFFKQAITEARARLAGMGIVNAAYLNAPLITGTAYAPHQYDWRILCVAALL